ncbi:hypothetical protein Tdes44962_MAKER03139 [Teratosphaeria destructans]|uniref:Uncharacterized protein n=1 Tax=Teratosphaeria destructans TaxID=418781 RepID=A0A9W7W1P9_9PEZI|nr:hypothetical protein Tdes44962_MAKER03139 [Teratosphaeria destructans]
MAPLRLQPPPGVDGVWRISHLDGEALWTKVGAEGIVLLPQEQYRLFPPPHFPSHLSIDGQTGIIFNEAAGEVFVEGSHNRVLDRAGLWRSYNQRQQRRRQLLALRRPSLPPQRGAPPVPQDNKRRATWPVTLGGRQLQYGESRLHNLQLGGDSGGTGGVKESEEVGGDPEASDEVCEEQEAIDDDTASVDEHNEHDAVVAGDDGHTPGCGELILHGGRDRHTDGEGALGEQSAYDPLGDRREGFNPDLRGGPITNPYTPIPPPMVQNSGRPIKSISARLKAREVRLPAGSETFILTADPYSWHTEQARYALNSAADGLYLCGRAAVLELEAHLSAQRADLKTARDHGQRRHPKAWRQAEKAGRAIAAAAATAPGEEMDMVYFFRHVTEALDRRSLKQQEEQLRMGKRTWWQRRAKDPMAISCALWACDEFCALRRTMAAAATVLLMTLVATVYLCAAVKSPSLLSSDLAATTFVSNAPVHHLQYQPLTVSEPGESISVGNFLPLADGPRSIAQVWQEHRLQRDARAYAIGLSRQAF